jgi:hypothetical protein
LKGASHEEVVNDIIDEVVMSGIISDEAIKICRSLNVWSVETPRYPAWLQGVWQSHPRHADLKKVSNQEAPKHPEVLGRAIRRAPHREAFIPDVKSWVLRTGWQGYKSTPTSEGHASRVPN